MVGTTIDTPPPGPSSLPTATEALIGACRLTGNPDRLVPSGFQAYRNPSALPKMISFCPFPSRSAIAAVPLFSAAPSTLNTPLVPGFASPSIHSVPLARKA